MSDNGNPSPLPDCAQGGAAPGEARLSFVPAWCRDLLADRAFWAVVLVWAACWLCWSFYLERYSSSLPWADEYDAFIRTGVATGRTPVTWEFLWEPTNEHRAPLCRLWVVLLGRAFNWNSRPMLQTDLAVLALGALCLIAAARSVRRRSSTSDAFLPLVLLTSAHQQTLANYVYANSVPLAVWCATAAAVAARWQTRSTWHLLLYVLGALVVTWAGGPAGSLWALGLCVPLALGWREPTGRVWKVVALAGGLAVAASAGLLIYMVPPPLAHHAAFRSESLNMTLRAAAKVSVVWMGRPILVIVWPWALLVLVVPGVYLLARMALDFRRTRWAAWGRWADLSALLVTAALVAVAIGQGRARYPDLWHSRYCALAIPIIVSLFLLLVRCDAPRALTTGLAIGMALCVGWNGPNTMDVGRWWRPQQVELTGALRDGHEPLSVLVEKNPAAIGWCKEAGLHRMIGFWQEMREANISIFDRSPGLARRCPLWYGDAGTFRGPLRRIDDPWGVGGHAVVAEGVGASATYAITVPADGTYKLCGRWMVTEPGRCFTVSVDGGPALAQPVPGGPVYGACVLATPLPLEGGTHDVTITWPCPGARLDILELTPQ
jgi:hypothetical protein